MKRRLDALLVAAVALGVHARSAAFGFTGLDDRDLVVGDRAFLADPASLLRVFGRAYLHVVDAAHAYWRPVVTASYVLDAQWSGTRPLGFHVTNVLLHGVASVLVMSLLRRFARGRAVPILGALVFAVHPALVSGVAWIPGRNDELVAVLGLGSWLALRKRRPVAHLALFALALMAKETALALPAVWLVEGIGARGVMRGRRRLAAAWAALLAARIAVHPSAPHAAARDVLANLPLLPAALGQIVLPVRPTAIAVLDDLPVWPGLVAAAACALVAWRVSRARRGLGFGAVVFAATLGPSLLVPGTLVLGSRLYLPAVGVLVGAATVARAVGRDGAALRAFGAVAVAAMAVVTTAFEGTFRDDAAFAREAVAGSPRSPLAHVCLGQARQRARDDDGALAEYRAALALGPAEVAHNDIAVIEMKRAAWPEAEAELRAELAVNPGFAAAHYNLAIVLRREARPRESCEAAREAVARAPVEDPAWVAELRRDCDE